MAGSDQQRILITQAQAGMVLAQPVFTQNRVPLCGAGTPLSEELIHRLTMRGVKRIHVLGKPLPDRDQQPFDERLAALQLRFSRIGHNPMMFALRDLIIEQMARER